MTIRLVLGLVGLFALAAAWWFRFMGGLLKDIECERTDLARDGTRCGLWSRHGAK